MDGHAVRGQHHRVPQTATSHPNDPVPVEPQGISQIDFSPRRQPPDQPTYSPRSSGESLEWHEDDTATSSDAPSTPATDPQVDEIMEKIEELPSAAVKLAPSRTRRASTTLISQSPSDIRRILGDTDTATKLIDKCCGGGCCFVKTLPPDTSSPSFVPVVLPDNRAFRSLNLTLGPLALDTELTKTTELPPVNVSFDPPPSGEEHVSVVHKNPPAFVQPHPPYNVFSAQVHHARELTKPGAEKRTYHFDIDVTDYPDEGGVDFKVGGAIGICPPNSQELVDDVFRQLGVPSFVRDKPVLMRTKDGRWPTIWGDEKPRELVTTRRELLTWCTDLQSHPPTKQLLRVMAEHASANNEKKILLYLSSAQGQAAFCE